ncbi:hypothetical protein EF808_02160 [archaeon]|nr:MAG: hypothetical protein EF808_02160 [archaeon]
MNTHAKEIVKRQFKRFTSNKLNIVFLAIAVFVPIIYEGLRFLPLEETMNPHTFPATFTIVLQDLLGTEGPIARFAAYYYVIPHLVITALLGPLFFFSKNRPPWVYMSIGIFIFIIDSIIYVTYPVAPPIRVEELEVVPIRIEYFAWSEKTITAHYSAIPSGHIFISSLGALISIIERWRKTATLYVANTIIMTVVIVYTGDHYLIDAIISVIFVAAIYKIVWYIAKKKGFTDHSSLYEGA